MSENIQKVLKIHIFKEIWNIILIFDEQYTWFSILERSVISPWFEIQKNKWKKVKMIKDGSFEREQSLLLKIFLKMNKLDGIIKNSSKLILLFEPCFLLAVKVKIYFWLFSTTFQSIRLLNKEIPEEDK